MNKVLVIIGLVSLTMTTAKTAEESLSVVSKARLAAHLHAQVERQLKSGQSGTNAGMRAVRAYDRLLNDPTWDPENGEKAKEGLLEAGIKTLGAKGINSNGRVIHRYRKEIAIAKRREAARKVLKQRLQRKQETAVAAHNLGDAIAPASQQDVDALVAAIESCSMTQKESGQPSNSLHKKAKNKK